MVSFIFQIAVMCFLTILFACQFALKYHIHRISLYLFNSSVLSVVRLVLKWSACGERSFANHHKY